MLKEAAIEDKTYTLNIRQTSKYQFEVTVPETGATKTDPTLDSALTITLHDIVKHLTFGYLILVFVDQHFDEKGWFVNPQERSQTDLEQQAAYEVEQLGIAPHVERRERHLVFEVSHPLTQAQGKWLDENAGKLFDRCNTGLFRDGKQQHPQG